MNKGLYHVTARSNLHNIMTRGILPMCGPNAYAQGQEHKCINVYTSREAVRDALTPGGDYMSTHENANRSELCVLNIAVSEIDQRYIDKYYKDMCVICRIVPPTDFIVLDTQLRQIPSTELAVITAE